MENKIIKLLKGLNGSLLGIGLDNELMLDAINENDNIDLCYLFSNAKIRGKKFNSYGKGKNKTVNIKKLRKYFKKKSLDNVVCNYEVIKKYIRGFVSNSVYINRDKLYIYGNLKDLESLEEKYKRYTDDIEIKKEKDCFLLTVNNKNTKVNFFKDTKYKVIDFVNDTIEFITDLLVN